MNPNTATLIVDGFLRGAFDVFNAMLSLPFDFSAEAPQPFSGVLADQYPVAFQGRIKNNLGQVVLLFATADAARFAATIMETEPSTTDALTEEDIAALREAAGPTLGGGVSNLMERFGRGVEQLDVAQIAAPVTANQLTDFLGANAVACLFSFTGGDLSGKGVFAYSESMEKMAPEGLQQSAPVPPTLSPNEMADILSGFEPAPEPPKPAPPARAGHENMDMVLDIRLEATARLGRVLMPIGDILNLGPGSIIEVGHLVDEPIDLLINDKLIARGDVVVVDEKFGLRITEIVSQQARIESLR